MSEEFLSLFFWLISLVKILGIELDSGSKISWLISLVKILGIELDSGSKISVWNVSAKKDVSGSELSDKNIVVKIVVSTGKHKSGSFS